MHYTKLYRMSLPYSKIHYMTLTQTGHYIAALKGTELEHKTMYKNALYEILHYWTSYFTALLSMTLG